MVSEKIHQANHFIMRWLCLSYESGIEECLFGYLLFISFLLFLFFMICLCCLAILYDVITIFRTRRNEREEDEEVLRELMIKSTPRDTNYHSVETGISDTSLSSMLRSIAEETSSKDDSFEDIMQSSSQ